MTHRHNRVRSLLPAILALALPFAAPRDARAADEENGGSPSAAAVPDGLERVNRPPVGEEERAVVRDLVARLLEGPEARASASKALVAMDWKAVPQLEAERWTADYPLAVFVEAVLETMPLSAWARDGEFIRKKDGMVMVFVPPGEIPMPNWALQPGVPKRPVRVDGFFIDRFCVTNRMFARFLQERGASPEGYRNVTGREEETQLTFEKGTWGWNPGFGHHPVWAPMSWQCEAYASWAGALLPTGAQWERAAGASDGRPYPWGDGPPDPRRAQTWESPLEGTVPVWWLPEGDSPFGLRQMTGNVLEYTLDRASDDRDDTLVVFDGKGGNPVAFSRGNRYHRLLKGGGVDEGEDAFPVRGYERLCGG